MKKRISIIMISFALFLLTGCTEDTLQSAIVLESGTGEKASGETISEKENMQEDTLEVIKVHICGEVYFPGVYTVYSGSRIYEVVKAAGGFTKEADMNKVNQAREVSDGEQIYIPSVYEKDTEDSSGLIDINSATKEVLCTIPGIGETRAEQIIKYRETYGRFTSIEDIMNVSGIKEGTFEKIAPYITAF